MELKSLQTKMTVIIIIIVLVSLGTLGGLNYWKSRQLLLNSVEEITSSLAVTSAQQLGLWLDDHKSVVSMMAHSTTIMSGNIEIIVPFLKSVQPINKEYVSITFIQPDGTFYDSTGFTGNVSHREYFQRAIKGETLITDPYISMTVGLPVVAIVMPVEVNGKIIGCLSGVVSLESISKQVLAIKSGETGYAFVIQGDGLTIINPNKDAVLKHNSMTDSNVLPAVKEAVQKMIKGETGVSYYTFEGVDKLTAHAPIPGVNWSIGINVPMKELNGRLSHLTLITVVTTIIVLIVAVFAVVIFARRISKPIKELGAVASRVARGDMTVKNLVITSDDEVGQLVTDFNNMTIQLVKRDAELHEAYDELEMRVLERTAELGEANQSLEREISERKYIEKTLRAERSLFVGGPTIVFLWGNAEGWPVQYVSSNVYHILGYTVEDFLSGKFVYTSIIHPDDLEQVAAEVLMHTNKQETFFEKVYRIMTASGEMRWVLSCTVVKRNLSGQVTHYHSYMNDITERKLFEIKLAHLDRLNMIGEVAAGMGHEVRNPMTTVRGYLQLFQRKEEFAKYQDQLVTMIEELDRANSIITEFLSLAKNKAVEKKQGNLNNVIQSLFPILQAEIFHKGHHLQEDLGEIPDSVFDEKEIRQLILNMVRNGLDAMECSGVVTIKTYSENGNIILAIQDTGSGISTEVLDKLGTPFLTTKDSGTGLGLSICYRIADRHGASIEVNTGFEGTTFNIIFHPVAPNIMLPSC